MKKYLLAISAFLLATGLRAQDSVKLNSAITYQTIKGWGGTGGENTQFENCPPYLLTQIINESVTGLGLTGLRYESYQGSYSQSYGMHRTWEWTNDNGSPDTLAESALDTGAIDYYMENLFVPWKNQVVANGDNFNFYMSPSWYLGGSTGDIPAFLHYSPGEYAEYYISNLNHLKNRYGLVPDYVTMCNEAGNNNQFTWQLVATMIQSVMPRIQAAGYGSTWLQFPECVSPQISWQYIFNSESTAGIWPYIKSLSYHLYGTNDPYRAEIDSFAQSNGMVTAQTEQIGQGSDALFADLTIGNVSYWDFYGNSDYCPQNASNTWYSHAAKYWTCRQIMHYNRPGCIRINAVSNDSPKVRALAFTKGGQITTTLFNDNIASVTTTVTVTGLPAGTYGASQIFASGSPYLELGLFTVTGTGTLKMPMPNQSIITIYPHSVNLPPVPVNWAAAPTYIELPTSSVVLTSSGLDPELSTVGYHWTVDSFPTGATVVLSNPNIAGPTVTGMTKAGNYVFTINMTDGSTDTTKRQVTVPVFPGNQAPIIEALQSRIPVIITLPVDTSIIHGFAFDIEGDALTYLYSIVSQPVGASAILTTPTASNTDVTNMTIAGDYTVRYSVSDPTHTVFRDILLTVYPKNDTPVITSVTATPPVFSAPTDSTQLSAVTSDPNGDVITHWWTVVSAPAGANPTFSMQGERITEARKLTIPGRYIFQLTLVDRTLFAIKPDTVMVELGTATVCQGSTTSLSDPVTGGVWSSSNTSVATVTGGTGLITGISGGTATITYKVTGVQLTGTVTVLPPPGLITGPATVCIGNTISLSDATSGGTWTSGNTGVASIGSGTGVVTGVSAGTSGITYTVALGCATIKTVTVNASSPITGITTLCTGTSTTLSDAATGGTWASSNTSIATIGSGTGIVSALIPGTSTITYTLPTGCIATTMLTVTYTPSVILGPSHVCLGLTITLTDGIGGGTWTSSNTFVATIGSGSGIVSGVTTGVTTISYSMGAGCTTTTAVTVDPAPFPIIGPSTVCAGQTVTLTDAGGGTWSSGNTVVATVGLGTGNVAGIAAGTATITYTLGTGCFITKTINVLPAPTALTGLPYVCVGSTVTLSDGIVGGTWASSNSAIAVVGFSGGVTGISPGTASITYSLGSGCLVTQTETVITSPSIITGPTGVCIGATILVSDVTAGGTWSSSNTGVATIGSGSGLVTGISFSTATITYSVGTSCWVTETITVVPAPTAIFGPSSLCAGGTVALSDGVGGGAWTSSNTAVFTAGISSGIVTGVAPGTASISYSLGTGCMVIKTETVVASSPITGATALCTGATTTLSDAVTGGTWSSGNTAVATIGSGTGIVSSLSAGTSTITYTLLTGCVATAVITVATGITGITGTAAVCAGDISILSDAVSGGTWSSSATAIAYVDPVGVVTGISAGVAIITYSLGTGCIATHSETVNPLPAGITGTETVCPGLTTTLSDVTTGGIWVSMDRGVATIGSVSGVASGISAGTSTISYTLFSTGCAVSETITVTAVPAITGSISVCKGLTTALTDATGGGTWTSSNTTVATIGAGTGIVTGVSAGTSAITYTLPGGCITSVIITITSAPSAITGAAHVCTGSTTTLSDAVTGGAWSSGTTGIATAGAGTGIVTGVSAGTATISYSLGTGCAVSITVTVDPLPVAGTITGRTSVCKTDTVILNDIITGGAWRATNSLAIVSGGIVTGVFAGKDTIDYTVTNTCGTATATFVVTVNSIPGVAAITGADSVCESNTIILSDITTGGIWSSSNGAVATVSGEGVVSGISVGIDTIYYSLSDVCGTNTADLRVSVVSCTEGIMAKVPEFTRLKVEPNPNQGSFTINLLSDINEPARVVITNLLGEKVKEFMTATNKPVDVKMNQAVGVYLLSVSTAHGKYDAKVVIE